VIVAWLAGIQAACFVVIGLASLGLSIKRHEKWTVGPKIRKGDNIVRYLGDSPRARMEAARDLLEFYSLNLGTYRNKVIRMRVGAWTLAVQTALLLILSLRIAGLH
jgi:hypothetical protein